MDKTHELDVAIIWPSSFTYITVFTMGGGASVSKIDDFPTKAKVKTVSSSRSSSAEAGTMIPLSSLAGRIRIFQDENNKAIVLVDQDPGKIIFTDGMGDSTYSDSILFRVS